MKKQIGTSLILFRNDLRIHDNQALLEAALFRNMIPLYVFDPARFGETSLGFPRVGPHRIAFLLESVETLRRNLRKRNSELVIRVGPTHRIIAGLAAEYGVRQVFMHTEPASEERDEERAIAAALEPYDAVLCTFEGGSLYHTDDLPGGLQQIPDVFTPFRKRVELKARVRDVTEMPQQFAPCPVSDPGELPEASRLQSVPEHMLWNEARADTGNRLASVPAERYRGGEDAGLERLRYYFWKTDALSTYKDTRNGLLGTGFSSKFSLWLATGALSPRYIYQQVCAYEQERLSNPSTYWMKFELLWREYFRFVFMKHGNALFKIRGLRTTPYPISPKPEEHLMHAWQLGRTGIPFIDANMRELLLTGYMSNRGRQNVASFFTWNLRQPWTAGAAWFESLLLDYDPCSNWGNWAYNSGVGNDPRQRYFNILSQADRYDKDGDYVRYWIPKLSNIPTTHIHQPHTLSAKEQRKFDILIGKEYPQPVIDLQASYRKLNG